MDGLDDPEPTPRTFIDLAELPAIEEAMSHFIELDYQDLLMMFIPEIPDESM